jgi:hypothetical protein
LARDGQGRAQAPLKNANNVLASLEDLGSLEIGTSDPIDADENSPQRTVWTSGMGFGREGATCELIEIMQIPPRFEQRSRRHKSIAGVLQQSSADGARRNENLQSTCRICAATRRALSFDLAKGLC